MNRTVQVHGVPSRLVAQQVPSARHTRVRSRSGEARRTYIPPEGYTGREGQEEERLRTLDTLTLGIGDCGTRPWDINCRMRCMYWSTGII